MTEWNFPVDLPPGDFAAYIFDCDGTLIDSMPLHWHAWRAALTAAGATFEFTEAMHHEFAGMSIPEIVLACNERFGTALDPAAVERGREDYFFQHLSELQPVGPVVALARQAHGRIKLGVASGSARSVVLPELEHLGLTDLFPVIVTASDVARSKPFPDMFLRVAELLGVAPEKCLVFEDGQNGLEAAAAAGMQSVYIPTNE
jgi:HAD superfamily hydrolase (TIGR01509 family)